MDFDPTAKCSGYLNMFDEENEAFTKYFFELENGFLSCFCGETAPNSGIGSEPFGDPINLTTYILQIPSETRILLCEVKGSSHELSGMTQIVEVEDESDEGSQIQLEELDSKAHLRWAASFRAQIDVLNNRYKAPTVLVEESRARVSEIKMRLLDDSSHSAPVPLIRSSSALRISVDGANIANIAALASAAAAADAAGEEPTVNDAVYQALLRMLETAEKTIDMLRAQVRTAGKIPLEYIPLLDLKEEIAALFEKAQSGEAYDDGRLDFLLMCMDQNPEHRLEKEKESRIWRENIKEYAMECLDIMRGFIPPHIQHVTAPQLEKEGMAKDLVKRLMAKKCLWLIRWTTHDIGRLHIADLTGRYNYEAQGLDIVELAALYAVVPEKFLSDDASGSKEKWRSSLEENLKSMYAQLKNGSLPKNKQRVLAYKGQQPFYTNLESYHTAVVVKGDVENKRASFMDLKRRSMSTRKPSSSRSNNVEKF